VTLDDVAKYSMTRRIERYLCDSWASCAYLVQWWIWLQKPHSR